MDMPKGSRDSDSKPPNPLRTNGMKNGRIHPQEQFFVDQNMDTKTDEWMSKQICRPLRTIKVMKQRALAAREANPIIEKDRKDSDRFKLLLRSREDWATIKKQYTDEEIKLFEFYWCRLYKQLPDMNHTEEMQGVKLIHFDLAMNRTLQAKKSIIEEIAQCEKIINREWRKESKKAGSGNRELIEKIETQRAILLSEEQSRTREFNNTMEKYNKLMEHLKATRDQRFSKVENAKISFSDWIRVHNEDQIRRRESHEAELSKVATQFATLEFGKEHRYEDGNFDRPILNADTIDIADDQETLDV